MAEDDEAELFLLHHTISRAFPHSSISTFTNAEDALADILDTGTDILITDHGMGKMSGTELIRDLRKRGFKLPIVMVPATQALKPKHARPARRNSCSRKMAATRSSSTFAGYCPSEPPRSGVFTYLPGKHGFS